jgi:hypothetical protein
MGEGGLDGRLVAAVRAGDSDTVRDLVWKGADPDAVDGADGLPVLCAAVAAYDEEVAQALVEGGADPDRELPDGTTPLWRAIDGGSPAVFSAVLGKDPRLRLPEAARERLLALARTWYETGAAEELRRRTGASGPAVPKRVLDDEYSWVEEVSLGGLVVRAGHGAILSSLEWAFRILTPVDELIARAMREPDWEHVDWSAICHVLAQRRSAETWSAVVAHRHHPSPAHREIVLDFLRLRSIMRTTVSEPDERMDGEFLAVWAAEETDSGLLARVLDTFTWYDHPGLEAIGLRYAGHPDPLVRREVPYLLVPEDGPCTPAARDALRTLALDPHVEVRLATGKAGARDEGLRPEMIRVLLLLLGEAETHVRVSAAETLAGSPDRTPAVADALAALIDDADLNVRLEAAYGLAKRDDPRAEAAIERVGPLGDLYQPDHRVSALWTWQWQKQHAIDEQ